MVSIIVPIYNNSEEELRKCINSLISQSYENIEIILIDDGSNKEETVAVEKKIASQYAQIRLIQQCNSGVSEARNTGIKEARGEYICFVDADDYVEFDMVENLISKVTERCLVVTNFVHNDSAKFILRMPEDDVRVDFDVSLIKEYMIGNLKNQIAFSVWNKMFCLKLVRENNIYFSPGTAIGEDMIFVLKYLSVCSSIRFINKGLYHYRIRETSAMNSANKDYLQLYCRTLAELKKLNFQGPTIAEDILNSWALEILTYVFTNSYVKDMTYAQFTDYYKKLIETSLFVAASKAETTRILKRDVLRWVLNIKNKWLLYIIIKVNH